MWYIQLSKLGGHIIILLHFLHSALVLKLVVPDWKYIVFFYNPNIVLLSTRVQHWIVERGELSLKCYKKNDFYTYHD